MTIAPTENQTPVDPMAQPGASEPHTALETTAASFRTDVLVASIQKPVLVEFWAPWCDPCRQISPALARVMRAAEGKALLYRMDIEAHPQIAGQLGVQSIPAVVAFQRGQPVDGFSGALSERQIKAFLERLVGPLGSFVETLVQAEAAINQNDAQTACDLAQKILVMEPENARAMCVYIKSLIALGETERASELYRQLPTEMLEDAALKPAVTALDLVEQSNAVDDIDALYRRIETAPCDYQARFDLALALNAHGDHEAAANRLLEIIKLDRAWNDDGARKQLLQFFEAWGPMDPATKGARRKLSALLFS